jgi:hypothetical protein
MFTHFILGFAVILGHQIAIQILAVGIVCLFVTMRPAGTRCICELYWHSITKVSIIIPSTRSTLPPGLSQNPRGIPQPRITLTSQAQGTKIHPHNLPDLLSGRGLTHEGIHQARRCSECFSIFDFQSTGCPKTDGSLYQGVDSSAHRPPRREVDTSMESYDLFLRYFIHMG